MEKKENKEPINIDGPILFICGVVMGILGLFLWAAYESMKLIHIL